MYKMANRKLKGGKVLDEKELKDITSTYRHYQSTNWESDSLYWMAMEVPNLLATIKQAQAERNRLAQENAALLAVLSAGERAVDAWKLDEPMGLEIVAIGDLAEAIAAYEKARALVGSSEE